MTFEMVEEIIISAANSVEKLQLTMKPTENMNEEKFENVEYAFELVRNFTSKKLEDVSFIRI